MSANYLKLRARIIEKYENQVNFAHELKTSEVTISKKLNEKVAFTRNDIVKWCKALDIEQDEIGSYFFAS